MSELFTRHWEITALSAAFLMLFSAAVWAGFYYFCYAVRSQVLGETVWCGNGGNDSVALTFDDGPAPDTIQILDNLQRENVKATFFLVGEMVEKYPEIARRIAADGHEIGNHSFSHPLYLLCTAKKTRGELRKTQATIEKITRIVPKLARPPYGVRTRAYFAAAKELNLQTIQWSDTGYDWTKITAREIAAKVLETAQGDSIILLHDGDSAGKHDRRATAEAIPLIVRGLREKGLRVSPLSEIHREIAETNHSFKLLPPIL